MYAVIIITLYKTLTPKATLHGIYIDENIASCAAAAYNNDKTRASKMCSTSAYVTKFLDEPKLEA